MSCIYNKTKISLLLINEEKKMVSDEWQQRVQPGRIRGSEESQHQIPSYNMYDYSGQSPVFLTDSKNIAQEMVKLKNLELANGNGRQLLEEGEDWFGSSWWECGTVLY